MNDPGRPSRAAGPGRLGPGPASRAANPANPALSGLSDLAVSPFAMPLAGLQREVRLALVMGESGSSPHARGSSPASRIVVCHPPRRRSGRCGGSRPAGAVRASSL